MANTEASLATMQADINSALRLKQQGVDESFSDLLSKTANKADNIGVDTAKLDESQLSRVIEMAWEDRTPFAAIEHSYGLTETDVIKLMRQELKPSSFRLWRQRVTGRATKHQAKRTFLVGRAHCKTQYKPR